MSGDHADVTYNTAWAGFWLLAEISLATVVTCLLSLPKFIEVHGKFVTTTFSNLSRPLISFTRLVSSQRTSSGHSRTKDSTVSEDLALDEVATMQNGSQAHLVHDNPYPPRDLNYHGDQGTNTKGNIQIESRVEVAYTS